MKIEPKLTADLHGFGSPTGRLGRQAMLYAQGLFESYRGCQPMPIGSTMSKALLSAEEAFLGRYSPADISYTAEWWRRMYLPVMVNKLRPKGQQIMNLNDLIRPETLAAMAQPLPRATAYPDYGIAPVWLIV